MIEEELQTNEISKSWVDDLPDLIKKMNNIKKNEDERLNKRRNLIRQILGKSCL